jgi:DNA-binding transcriptional MerR regulator
MSLATVNERSNRDKTYSITELCREFDVTPRTLRFYEQKGLLAPARRGWTRLFSYRDRARLQLILRGKKVGFSLEEIKEMLDLYNLRDGQLTQLRVASTKFRERLEALRKQRVELEEAITDLEKTVVVVDSMLTLDRRRGAAPQLARIRISGGRGGCSRRAETVMVR